MGKNLGAKMWVKMWVKMRAQNVSNNRAQNSGENRAEKIERKKKNAPEPPFPILLFYNFLVVSSIVNYIIDYHLLYY